MIPLNNVDRVREFCRMIYNGDPVMTAYQQSDCDKMTTVTFCTLLSKIFPDFKYKRFS